MRQIFPASRFPRFCSTSLAVALATTIAHAKEPLPPEPENSGKSIWTQNVTQFRKEHGLEGGYTKRWDLSDMPHYTPKQQVTGTLRIWGNNYIKDGDLGEFWLEGFKKFQPGITIEYHLPTEAIGIPALAAGVADLAMGNRATLSNQLIFEQVFHHGVSAVSVATGSYDVYGWSFPIIIAVNAQNPLTKISMKQLDGVFGSARKGGYVGSVWHTEYPYSRGPEENIRTWDQLGLTGDWAGKPIHIGGQNLSAGVTLAFSDKVLRGSFQFAEGYQAFANYITPDGKVNSWSVQARHAIANDKYAMFYVSPLTLSPELKELEIQDYDGGPYVKRTLESVRDRTYPLFAQQYFFFNRTPGEPIDPKVKEFVLYVLSQEGQNEIQREGRYLPLTGAMVREELKKLD